VVFQDCMALCFIVYVSDGRPWLARKLFIIKVLRLKNVLTVTGKHHLQVKKKRKDLLIVPTEIHVNFSIEFLFSTRTRFYARLIGTA
jgi:hypothetical protein